MNNNNEFITLFNKLNIDEQTLGIINTFIKTYDGTNTKEYTNFLAALFLIFLDYDVVKEQARGLQDLEKLRETYLAKFEKLKETFFRNENNKKPINPFHSA